MSGGQKQRISLARAVYSNASVIILDDPLSAVDAPTARHLLTKALLGPLTQGRTLLLITHAVSLAVPVADWVVVINGGEIIAQGTPADVAENPLATEITGRMLRDDSSSLIEVDGSSKPDVSKASSAAVDAINDSKGSKLVEKEDTATGSVKSSVYGAYVKAAGGIGFLIIFLLSIWLVLGVQFGNDYWLKKWSADAAANDSNFTLHISHASSSLPELTASWLFTAPSGNSEQFDVKLSYAYSWISLQNRLVSSSIFSNEPVIDKPTFDNLYYIYICKFTICVNIYIYIYDILS